MQIRLNQILNYDNRVFGAIRSFLDILALGLSWLACSCTILLFGPANAALYYAIVKTVRHERSYALKEYWRAFLKNLKQGLIVNLILLAFGVMIFCPDYPAIIMMISQKEAPQIIFLLAVLIKAMLYLGVTCWIYPLMSRFNTKVIKLLIVSLHTMLRFLPRTLLAVLVTLGVGFLCAGMPILILIVPGLVCYAMTFILEPVMKRFCLEQEQAEPVEDPWYME